MLAWLFGESSEPMVRESLGRAELVIASDLTLVECDGAVIREQAAGHLSAEQAAHIRARLAVAATRWHCLPIGDVIVQRAREPFPAEPVRSLDAVHLATAMLARNAVPDVALLSLDQRVRASGRLLGLPVGPE